MNFTSGPSKDEKVSIPICNFSNIRWSQDRDSPDPDNANTIWITGSRVKIQTLGETIEVFDSSANKTYFFKEYNIGLREEDENTVEKINRALLNLKSYCPKGKKDIFE